MVNKYSKEWSERSFAKRQLTPERYVWSLMRKSSEAGGRLDWKVKEIVNQLKQSLGSKKVYKILNPSYDANTFWLSEEVCRQLQIKWGAYRKFSDNKKKKQIIKALLELIKEYKEPTVLEVGCGAGHFMWEVYPYVKRVVGVDSSPHMLNITKEMFTEQGVCNIGLRHGTCWRLPFANKSFDIVFQVDVCMHVGGSWLSLKEMLRVAKKAVLFTGPSFELGYRQLDEKKKKFGLSWGVSQQLLEYEILKLEKRKPGTFIGYKYLPRISTKNYNHKILIIEKEYEGRKMKATKKSLAHEFVVENIGILCRGKSLKQLDKINKGFDHCFIINNWRKELPAFRRELKHKTIVHFVNHYVDSVLPREMYSRYNIERAVLYWTEKHLRPEHSLKDSSIVIGMCEKAGVDLTMMPDKFMRECNYIKNSGIMCCLYVAETFRPKNIWIAGMDFYAAEYWLGPLNDKQKKAAKDGLIERLVDEFLGVVERYPEVTFKIVTEYSKLPVDDYSNLKVIREKKK